MKTSAQISDLLLFLVCLVLLLTLFPSVAHAAPPADQPVVHTVKWGETLYSIALRYGTTVRAIVAANHLRSAHWIYAGQRLVIPVKGSERAVGTAGEDSWYRVRRGDTLYSIAWRHGTTVQAIAQANNVRNLSLIYVGQRLHIPKGNSGPTPTVAKEQQGKGSTTGHDYIHVVQRGETLAQIAWRYGTTFWHIAAANNLRNPSIIYIGQRLVIPGKQASAQGSVQTVPLNIRLTDVPLYRQRQTLTCEEAAAAMAARGAFSEDQLVRVMPRDANPFKGIRGRPNAPWLGSLEDYGVYAQGLQIGLARLGYASTVYHGQSYDQFKAGILAHLQAGHPVIWWNTWRDTYQRPVLITMPDGQRVKMVPYEHTVVLVGATDQGLIYHDPYDATLRSVSWIGHKRVSSYFDNMALVIH